MTGTRRGEHLLLLTVLVAAAGLRFTGIAHNLAREGPAFDERQNFVEPVLRMWRTGSPDPTVYPGYAGFFNYLLFLPVGLGDRLGGEVGGYVAARSVVAAFSTLSALLAYLLTRRVAGREAALLASALLAFSPLEVRAAHFVTADVLVGTALLGSLLVTGEETRPSGEARAGILLGLATAIKYSGFLLAPGIVTMLATKGRLRAALTRVSLVAAVAFLLAAPYAVFGSSDQGTGLAGGLETYYGSSATGNRFAQGEGTAIGAVLNILVLGLGPVGSALLAASLLLKRDRLRLLPPAAAVVVAGVAVMVPANLIYPRHVLPVAAVATTLAAAGFAGLLERLPSALVRRLATAALAAATLAPPLASSARLISWFVSTTAVDQAAAWLEREIPGPALVVSSLPRIRLDPSRFEVRLVTSLAGLRPGVLAWYDVVVAAKGVETEVGRGLDLLTRFPPEGVDTEAPVFILRPSDGARPQRRLAPPPRELHASFTESGLLAIFDGDPRSQLDFPGGSGWVEARWTEPIAADAVEVDAGSDPRSWPQTLSLEGTLDGRVWSELATEPLRPTRPGRQRQGGPHGQIYALIPPRRLTGLRISRAVGGPWSLAEVRVLVGERP